MYFLRKGIDCSVVVGVVDTSFKTRSTVLSFPGHWTFGMSVGFFFTCLLLLSFVMFCSTV